MNLQTDITGIADTFYFKWEGKAVPINQRSMIGRKGSGPKAKHIIIKSQKYRNFCADLDNTFYVQKLQHYTPVCLEGPVMLLIQFHRAKHNHHAVDSDACEKPVRDALEKSGIIKNDKQVLGTICVPLEPTEAEYDVIELSVLQLGPGWQFSTTVGD